MILAEDDDLGRASWSWQKMTILAEDRDFGRTTCSCQNSLILLGNNEPPLRPHFGTTSGSHQSEIVLEANQITRNILASFWKQFGTMLGLTWESLQVHIGIHVRPLCNHVGITDYFYLLWDQFWDHFWFTLRSLLGSV